MQGFTIPQITLADGQSIPVLGQGTWNMGEKAGLAKAEAQILREGIELGLSLIDTAEMYADGGAERVTGRAIAGFRDQVFLVSKILPQHASAAEIPRRCDASLRRLGTEMIDLYLLHWEGPHPLAETIAAFGKLQAAGKIRYWGVSNFHTAEMDAVMRCPGGTQCATNQVLYHPGQRGTEFDLLPWCREKAMPVMAYSPLGQGGALLRSPALRNIARRHDASAAQIALAWSLRDGNTIAIPKASNAAHLRENAAAAQIRLGQEDLAEIDAEFPPAKRKQPLAMI